MIVPGVQTRSDPHVVGEAAPQELFLGRQPILDRKLNLAAFELLFRAGHFNGAKIEDDLFASATVINHAFTELGLEEVLGKHQGFINLNASLLMSDVIELLPPSKIVLEILETVKVSSSLLARCRDLKAAGYTLALDDFRGLEREFTPLLEIVDIVKVDVQNLPQRELEVATHRLQQLGLKLLAEKVDSRSQADRCIELGYELFQGYFFAKPSILTTRRLSGSEAALMRLLELLLAEGTGDVEAVLSQHPQLADALARLARAIDNADSFASPGVRRPQRWLPLLIYMVSGVQGAEFPSPLLILAATRGKQMELLARAARPQDRGLQERAFLTGTLSLVNALLPARLIEILSTLPVADDVRSALLSRHGDLGALLAIVQALENADLYEIEHALSRMPTLDHGRVISLQVEAMRWANLIGDSE
jgi:EAL and modified HD-GYP domain-containing signal transduction protein